jgi:hypothetical protein
MATTRQLRQAVKASVFEIGLRHSAGDRHIIDVRSTRTASSRLLSNLLEVREVMGQVARQELCDPIDR